MQWAERVAALNAMGHDIIANAVITIGATQEERENSERLSELGERLGRFQSTYEHFMDPATPARVRLKRAAGYHCGAIFRKLLTRCDWEDDDLFATFDHLVKHCNTNMLRIFMSHPRCMSVAQQSLEHGLLRAMNNRPAYHIKRPGVFLLLIAVLPPLFGRKITWPLDRGVVGDNHWFRVRPEPVKKGAPTRFEWFQDPVRTRFRCRLHLKIREACAALKFAHIVFVCDALHCLRPKPHKRNYRFFTMAARLPLELQRVLCLRGHGVTGISIPLADEEGAFLYLAAILTC